MMNENDETPQAAVGLEEALRQMNEEGCPPDGFHMMFFSTQFELTETCPTNILLKKITTTYNCDDTLKRQVFKLPKGEDVISYEFAWFGEFDELQETMESIDKIVNDNFHSMLNEGIFTEPPKARVQFLVEAPINAHPKE
tara:strand:+ start:986 stop:1405 length:420 start_codon:yes stop_codon:yes gene_type:complete